MSGIQSLVAIVRLVGALVLKQSYGGPRYAAS